MKRGRPSSAMTVIEQNLRNISRWWGEGVSLGVMADRIKVPRSTFYHFAEQIGLPPNTRKPKPKH